MIAGHLGSPALAQSQYAFNQEPSAVIRDSYGEVGLLDMPGGHMADDGQFGFNVGSIQNYQRYAFWFQALPWLEASFRYSRAPYWLGNLVYYDRSLGVKLRVLNEADGLADVSIGVRDLLGTGVYGAEYVVASRHVGDFDLTAGMGWGRLADDAVLNNPIGVVSHSFQQRMGSNWGDVSTNSFFHGKKVGLFGGAAWQSPLDGLSVLAEYSSDKYTTEALYGKGLKVRSPVNVGLNYRPLDTFAVTAGWYYGTTYGVTLTLSADPTTEYPSAVRVGPAIPAPALRSTAEQQSALQTLLGRHTSTWVNAQPSAGELTRTSILQALHSGAFGVRDAEIRGNELLIDARLAQNSTAQCQTYARIALAAQPSLRTVVLADLARSEGQATICQIDPAKAGSEPSAMAGGVFNSSPPEFDRSFTEAMAGQNLQLDAMWIHNGELWVYYENYGYRDEAEAVGRVLRVLMASAPSTVEIFHIVPVQLGVPQRQIKIARSTAERSFATRSESTKVPNEISVRSAPMADATFREQSAKLYPSFSWALDPKLSEHYFDPDKPLQFMAYADATGLLQLAPGLMISTELTGTLWSDYTFSRDADSALPHVRTDLLQYLKHGAYGISGLQAVYRSRLAPEIFTEVRAGLLEDMFAGVGGQVLWRPAESRFAFGADLYGVQQRDYSRLFGLRPYQTITGHVSAYYESPWYNLNFAVHAGRYLAGDRGATFEFSRRFSSGVEIGAWVTFTNVSKQQFGEGSFDKGIMIHIPFEWGLPIHSQSAYDLHMSSLTRDGGQRLADDDGLYLSTRQASYGEIEGHLNNVFEP